jgi:hypothetical protein
MVVGQVVNPPWFPAFLEHLRLTFYFRAGGVIVLGGKGKIILDNTLQARLALLKELGLPAIRGSLFGENENRKYFD